MKKKILVSGGLGFIGRELLTQKFIEKYDVHVIDCLLPQVHGNQAKKKIERKKSVSYHIGDIRNPKLLDRILSRNRFEIFVHLAAETGTGQSLQVPTLHTDTNVNGLACILQAFSKNNSIPEKIINTSSRAIYGEGLWIRKNGETFYPRQRTREDLIAGKWDFSDSSPLPMDARILTPKPVSVYGVTKFAQEDLLRVWSSANSVSLINLRLQNVFGSGQSPINPYTGILPLFIQKAKSNESIELYEDGKVTRDFIHVKDVVAAIHLAVEKIIDSAIGSNLDIGAGTGITLLEISTLIAKFFGSPDPFVSGKFRLGDVRHAYSNIDFAWEYLGWKPKLSLEQGIEELLMNGQSK